MSTPQWTEAPAVLARLKFWTPGGKRIVFSRDECDHGYWRAADRLPRHWSELVDVTPLYPKDTARPLPTREEIANALHGDNCPDDPDPDEHCSCGAGDYDRMGDIVLALLEGQDK